MMVQRYEIKRSDIMAMADYGKIRAERRKVMAGVKRDRRVSVGPFATFYFESYETMWHQVHEMLFIEKGGDAQVADELTAYNPLIPNGRELVATVMFEIEDPVQRKAILARLGGVENTMSITLDGERIAAIPEGDVERTSPDGKASSVQFMHFAFTPAQIEKFKKAGARVLVAIEHPDYAHIAVMPEAVRAALSSDFA